MIEQRFHTELVLVGGGHSHIQVIKKFAMNPLQGVRLTLVSDTYYAPYSGMLPGYLAGWYDYETAHFDLASICQKAGIRFICDKVIGLDTKKKEISFQTRPSMSFDFVSVNVGITPTPLRVADTDRDHFLSLKPISKLLSQWKLKIDEMLHNDSIQKIALIGAGASSVEIAVILKLLNRKNPKEITIYQKSSDLLRGHSRATKKILENTLKQHQIKLMTGVEIVSYQNKKLMSLDNREFSADLVFCSTHASAPQWFKNTDLKLKDGFIQTDQYLRAEGSSFVFASGDCIEFSSKSLLKSGVYAVRQGPVLAENLRRSILKESLKKYRPQKNVLALITTDEKKAMASWGPIGFQFPGLWKLKDWIDHRFMNRFKEIPSMMKLEIALDQNNEEINYCGGCGSKVESAVIREVFSELKDKADIATDFDSDDAAVVSSYNNHYQLSSVDGFRSFITDPYLMAQIALNHSLNDLYAMGAKPKTVQSVMMLNRNSQELRKNDFKQMIFGVTDYLKHSGAKLVGGHTMENLQESFVFEVSGELIQSQIKKKNTLKKGDHLLLTKPLGTGALFASHMFGSVRGCDISTAIEQMLLSHHLLLDLVQNEDVHAATDITGFGLIGHLSEMLYQSEFSILLKKDQIPVLAGYEDCVKRNEVSFLVKENLKSYFRFLKEMTFEDSRDNHSVLFDPQTCGGLVLSVKAENSPQLLKQIIDRGFHAAMIGQVESFNDVSRKIMIQ